jgi:hypothetical protein
MKTNENTHIALQLPPAISPSDTRGTMPGEFAGMYQAGFESGYSSGREAGYRQGFNEGYAAVHPGASIGAVEATAPVAKTASRSGPRRMLLGMPCERCRVYLLSDETHCPCCKQTRAA